MRKLSIETREPPEFVIAILTLGHPLEAGFVNSIGDAAGQTANYRLPLEDGKEVHVKEFEDNYRLHWDLVSAIKNPIGHLFSDAPHWIVRGLVGLALVGIILWAVRGGE